MLAAAEQMANERKKVSTSGVLVLLGVIIDSELTMLTKTLSPLIPFSILYVFATKHAAGLHIAKCHIFINITTDIRRKIILLRSVKKMMNGADMLFMIRSIVSP